MPQACWLPHQKSYLESAESLIQKPQDCQFRDCLQLVRVGEVREYGRNESKQLVEGVKSCGLT